MSPRRHRVPSVAAKRNDGRFEATGAAICCLCLGRPWWRSNPRLNMSSGEDEKRRPCSLASLVRGQRPQNSFSASTCHLVQGFLIRRDDRSKQGI